MANASRRIAIYATGLHRISRPTFRAERKPLARRAVLTSIGDQVETNPDHVVVTISAATIHAARIWAVVADLVKAGAAALAAWVVWTISAREDAIVRPEAVAPWSDGRADAPRVPPRPDL